MTGGSSFGTAATLPGSGHYGDVLQYGEDVFYRVHLSWGQALAWQVHYGQPADTRRTVNIEAKTFTPARQEVDADTTAYMGSPNQLPGQSGNHPDAAFATYPIEYQNRTAENNGTLQGESIDGWYYLAVKLGYGVGGSDQPGGGNVPVTLDVSVTGTAQAGPKYDTQATAGPSGGGGDAVQIFGGGGGPDATVPSNAASASGAASASATTSAGATGSSGSGAHPTTPTVNVGLSGASSKKSDGGTPWAVFLLAAVAVAASVAAGVFLRKARRAG